MKSNKVFSYLEVFKLKFIETKSQDSQIIYLYPCMNIVLALKLYTREKSYRDPPAEY